MTDCVIQEAALSGMIQIFLIFDFLDGISLHYKHDLKIIMLMRLGIIKSTVVQRIAAAIEIERSFRR